MTGEIGAMILAAGRGERMRPLSDTTPKPLLQAGGKPLIVWQIEGLVRAGFRDIVVNAAHLQQRFVETLGDGTAYGARLHWSFEPAPLEVAGGIATALPLLPPGPAVIVAGDVYTTFDYASFRARAEAMSRDAPMARVHLVLVPNPPYHPSGDFALVDGRVALEGAPRHTYASIGVYDTALFRELPRGSPLKLLPYLQRWIASGQVSGETFAGTWANVGSPADLAQLDAELRAASTHRTTQFTDKTQPRKA
jgi:MurNAc alpha-1-phosphate uridylyltransferase